VCRLRLYTLLLVVMALLTVGEKGRGDIHRKDVSPSLPEHPQSLNNPRKHRHQGVYRNKKPGSTKLQWLPP